MTNIFKTREKVERKERLFSIGVETLEAAGWAVTREVGLGKSSVRRIAKGEKSLLVSIRTTQDTWIAFPPKSDGKGWITLDDVDVVLAVSVDGNEPPKNVLVHWLDAKEMRDRFDRAAKARRNAGRQFPKRRGIWIPLYIREEDGANVSYVGGGAGLDHKPIAQVPLAGEVLTSPSESRDALDDPADDRALTIPAAKRRLALSLGVPESSIRITVEA